MRLGKIRNSVIIGALMVICFAAGSYATDGVKEIKAFLREDFKIKFDGRAINLKNSVLVHDGTSYLPLREMGLLFNAGVDWVESDRTVILTSPTVTPAPTTSAPATQTPTTPTPTPASNITYPSEIKFSNVITYKVTVNNKIYYLLANQFDGILYFRQSDILKLNLDVSGLKTVKESYTSDLFYPANELSAVLMNIGQFDVTNEAIYDETNEGKLKVLKGYMPKSNTSNQAYYMRERSTDNEYEILFRGSDERFYFLQLRLVAQSNGVYYVTSTSMKYLYK